MILRMNEYQRMQYLDALGIETFVPRMVLPNAKPSLQCTTTPVESLVGELSIAGGKTKEDPSAIQLPKKVLGDVLSALNAPALGDSRKSFQEGMEPKQGHQLLEDAVGGPATKAEIELDGGDLVSRQPDSLDDQAAEFDLALWFTDTHLQIMDSRSKGDALPTSTLLSNLLIATGWLNTNLGAPEVQRWPIAGMDVPDQSWSAAASMIFDFLAVRHESKAPKAFLLFGKEAAQVILGAGFEFEECLYSITKSDRYSALALVLPSLRELLYEPRLKRNLWRSFNQLKSRS